jgi:hypothetical protein
MAIQASVNFTVQLPSASNFSTSWMIKTDALDRASITLAKGKTGKLELQPGTASEILLLVITSTDYTGAVTFTFGGPTWQITEPQIVAGPGMMNAITHAPGDPNHINFDNSAGTADVNIDVLVLRTAFA